MNGGKGLAVACLLLAGQAHANVTIEGAVAVVVGADLGSGSDEPLRFAESDARRFRDLLVELAGVAERDAVLLLGAGPEEVRRAIGQAAARAAQRAGSGHRPAFIFYYSGHGDEQGLRLPQGRYPLERLRADIAAVPADIKLSFLDACRTSGQARGVRVEQGPSFALTATPEMPRGTVELRASAEGEVAQESEELAGALFTHFLVSGLRGAADVDGDDRVTLNEVYAHTYRRTLMRTGAGAALQHPTVSMELSGAGEVVLTRSAAAAATLEVPGGAERYLVFALPSAAVMGELAGEGPRRLALPSGRFLVVRRAHESAGVAQVDLSWGGRQRLEPGDFQPVAEQRLASRGALSELRQVRLEPQLGLELAPRGPERPGWRAGLGVALRRTRWELELRAAYVAGAMSTPSYTGDERTLTAAACLGWLLAFRHATLGVSLDVEVRYSEAKLLLREADRAAAAGFPTADHFGFWSAGPGLGVRVEVPMGHHISLSARAGVVGLLRREAEPGQDAKVVLQPTVSSALGVGYAF